MKEEIGTVTIFVEPRSFTIMIQVLSILKNLEMDNGYVFQPKDLIYTTELTTKYIWLTLSVTDYIKLEYCKLKLS